MYHFLLPRGGWLTSTLIVAITIPRLENIRSSPIYASVPDEAVESKLVIQTAHAGFLTDVDFAVDDGGIECLKLCPRVVQHCSRPCGDVVAPEARTGFVDSVPCTVSPRWRTIAHPLLMPPSPPIQTCTPAPKILRRQKIIDWILGYFGRMQPPGRGKPCTRAHRSDGHSTREGYHDRRVVSGVLSVMQFMDRGLGWL